MPTPEPCGFISRRVSGFTLVELVTTLVLVAIVAAVAVPRFVQSNSFEAFGFTEQTRAALRYAQKAAVAKRRQVCVDIASNTLTLTAGTVFGGACSATDRVLNPADGSAYVQSAPNGISITSASFSFDPLGRPSAAQTLIVSGGDVAQTILIEAETGLVH